MKKVIITLLVMAFVSASAFGQTQTPKINKRQVNQHARIHQGVKSGQLTKPEKVKLKAEQRNIQRTKVVAKSDGKVTPREKKIITAKQNKANRDIYRLKHNNRTR